MIMRKQVLSMPARRHFKLLRDPCDDPQTPEDVYVSPENRFVRETVYDAPLNGIFSPWPGTRARAYLPSSSSDSRSCWGRSGATGPRCARWSNAA